LEQPAIYVTVVNEFLDRTAGRVATASAKERIA
jgi:hypothetical protein